MTTATAIYRAIMVEVERRRLQLGWPMWQLDDAAGVQDGYYSKALWADGRNGRQVRWDTLELVVEALFPAGYDVIIKPKKIPCVDATAQRLKIRSAAALTNRLSQREHMAALGRVGRQNQKLPPQVRRLAARRAARARWRRYRERKRNEAATRPPPSSRA